MAVKYSAVRGMDDIRPPETLLWGHVEAAARDVFESFGCHEIRTPILEKTELFVRSIGEATAVVEKEMYTFLDRNGESVTLRPEATASVVRSYIEEHGSDNAPAKYFYIGPMFRHERPQKGRKRQFHQIGVELIGSGSPAVDAEVMAMCSMFFLKLGISDYTLEINSIGCPACRPGYNAKFLKFLKEQAGRLCADCARRIEKNPLRAFDCKVEGCIDAMKSAPLIGTHLCAGCSGHFKGVQEYLKLLRVPFAVNHRIVRGLDYYVRTAFEFTSGGLGAQNAVCAGGRYDGLVKAMGGPDIAGAGFSIGVERLVMLMEKEGKSGKFESELVFFALLGGEAVRRLLPVIYTLRSDGVNIDWDYDGRSLKSQMRQADRLKAHTVVIVGESELAEGLAVVKNMHTGEQERVRLDDLPRHFVHVEV